MQSANTQEGEEARSHPTPAAAMDLLFLEKLLVGLFASVVVAIAVSKIRGRNLRVPPGPLPVPIFGNWLQVGDDLNHRNLAALARKFGEIFLLRMGQRNLVVVSSPPLAREALHTQDVEFGSRTRNVVFDIFTGKGQDMVFTVYGDHWRKTRRIMTVPFFTNKVVQQYHPGWEAEAAAVVDAVRADPKAATEGVVLCRHLQLMMYNNMDQLRARAARPASSRRLRPSARERLAELGDWGSGSELRAWIRQYRLWIWCHRAWSSVYRIVRWWLWSMCSHQHWIVLVIGVLSLGVGWVPGESLCLAVGLTRTIPLGAVLFLGGVCLSMHPSSLEVDLAGEIPDHVGRAAAAWLRRVPS